MSERETVFHVAHALLPEGWVRDVRITVRDGVIVSVAPDSVVGAAQPVDGIVLPGLTSLHSHTFQRGMAGLSEVRGPTGDSFWTWREVMYRFLERLRPEDVAAIAAYAMMEMLEAGFTAVGEFHYLHHQPDGMPYANVAEMAARITAAAAETGIGLTLLPVLYRHGGFGGVAPAQGQRRFISTLDGFHRLMEDTARAITTLPDARLGLAPHSLRAVDPDSLATIVAAYPDLPLHIHVAEQTREVEECRAALGAGPVTWLLDHHDVDVRWCLVHATHMTDQEAARLAASGAVAGLCPITEANLGDGIFNAAPFLAAGGRYGIGTDSNVQITAAGELRQLEYSQRLARRMRNAMTRQPGQSTGAALYVAAARDGAAAIGRPAGLLALGQRADWIVLDPSHPDLVGLVGDAWLDATVFVTDRAAIRETVVGGRTLVRDGRHVAREPITRRFTRTMARLRAAL